MDEAMQRPRRDRIGVTAAREQPPMRERYTAQLALALAHPQQGQQMWRHRIAIPGALTLLDPEQRALAGAAGWLAHPWLQ